SALLDRLGVGAVDCVDPYERVELLLLLTLAWLAHGAGDGVTLTQSMTAHHGQRHVHVVGPRQVTRRPDERVVVQDVEDAGHRNQDIVLGNLDLLIPITVVAATVPVVVAATVAAPTTIAIAAVVIVTPVVLLAALAVALLTVPLLTVTVLSVVLLTALATLPVRS